MVRIPQDFLRRPLLDDVAAIHDKHPRGESRDNPEVVRDEDYGHAEAFFQRPQQFHDLGLDGHVQCGGRFVRDQHVRLAGQRHGNHNALLHPAAQLMRVIMHTGRRIEDTDCVQPADDLRVNISNVATMQTDRFADLVAYSVNWVERCARFLENVGDLAAAQFAQAGRVHRHDTFAVEKYFPLFYLRRRHRQ